uniref:Metalloendopeptidase n=1 Tax=Tetraodon nigroviridis TaxID=99883 RepID=H3CLP7_TETNG
RWQSPVPYVLDKSLEMNAKGIILQAFDQFRIKSCIDFKPWDSERFFLIMKKLDGCFSYVGKVMANGQELSIGASCDSISIAEHEILHALGFYHEQSRYDRDDYVEIVFENIQSGKENNFRKVNKNDSITNGVPYDYLSVMHYGKNAFSNGIGPTIVTKDPAFQDVIGQRLEMSPSDVLELNRLYNCTSSVAFMMGCSFSGGSACEMSKCEDGDVVYFKSPPKHINTNHSIISVPGVGYFMHANTAAGMEGDSAWLETKRLTPTRSCPVQCLQFYFCQLGNQTDQLNIWVREFQDERDQTGTLRLVDQITGDKIDLWRIHHVSLNATKPFQVVFEVRKGAGNSSGGFSIDDINLSETRCPDFTMQFDHFEALIQTSKINTAIYSPRLYSPGGYAYRVGILLQAPSFALFVQLLSGENDERLEWPCPRRQVTSTMLDQSSNIQQHMSKQRSFTSDLSTSTAGSYLWDNPRKIGNPFTDKNNETIYGGPWLSFGHFSSLTEIREREFVKGGSTVFTFKFDDLTPLVNGSNLPCPGM